MFRPQPVVVSEAMARRLFGSGDVVGRELRMPEYQKPPTALRVIGVTRDAHVKGVDSPPDPTMYLPLAGSPLGFSGFVLVRSNLDSARVGRMVRDAATALDPAVPFKPETTYAEMIDQRLSQQRLFAWVLGLLGTIAFTLAAVGLNGLVAQTVIERAREFGIRLAIGADRSHVMRLVLRQATVVGVTGLATGLTLAWFRGPCDRKPAVRRHEPRPLALHRRRAADDPGRGLRECGTGARGHPRSIRSRCCGSR